MAAEGEGGARGEAAERAEAAMMLPIRGASLSPHEMEIAKATHARVNAAVRAIADGAAGCTCGECACYMHGACTTQSLDGVAIEIHYPSAIACRHFQEEKDHAR